MGKAHNSPEYLKNRRALLKDAPLCHWCGKAPATTADHLHEVDAGGSHDLDNLVPACKACNSKRGARYVNAKTAAAKRAGTAQPRKAREPRTKTAPVLSDDPPRPRVPLSSLSRETTEADADEAGPIPAASWMIGRDTPRLETPRMGGSTYGPQVADWCQRAMGLDLYQWQRHALDGMLEYDTVSPAGFGLRHRRSLVTCARQQGKTVAIRALIGWYLDEMPEIRGEPVTVLLCAGTKVTAAMDTIFSPLASLLQTKHGAKVYWTHGRAQVIMANGSTMTVVPANPSAGHGYSPDLVVCDELWKLPDEAYSHGFIPSMRARRSALFSGWSTAGTEESQVMLRVREEALQCIDAGKPTKLHFAEWSVRPGADPMDEREWCWANPALGRTIELDSIREEARSPDRAGFLRGSCNLWIASDRAWLRPGVWAELEAPAPDPLAGGVVSVEQSSDEGRYYAVRAVPVEGRRVHVSVPFVVGTQAEMWDRLSELMAADHRLTLTVGATLELVIPPALARRTTIIGYKELQKYTGLVQQMVNEGNVLHDGNLQLSEHVTRAVAGRTQAGVVLTTQRSPGPIQLARCMVWAVALAAKPSWSQKPAMGRSR